MRIMADVLFTFAPCGKCEDCRNHSRYAWAWRLTSDVQYFVEKMGYKVLYYVDL